MEYRLVYITAGSEEEARKIGRALVEERLAACVNLFPIYSIYRWQGKIEEGPEMVLLARTRAALTDQVIARVKALHSYKVPDITVFQIEKGLPDYLRWIEESTRDR